MPESFPLYSSFDQEKPAPEFSEGQVIDEVLKIFSTEKNGSEIFDDTEIEAIGRIQETLKAGLSNLFSGELNQILSESEMRSFTDPKSVSDKLADPERAFERFLSHYIARKYRENVMPSVIEGPLFANLNRIFAEFTNIYENDMPVYDAMAKEFDQMQNESPFTEVYLGRDGIYAYEGRRAEGIGKKVAGNENQLEQIKYFVASRALFDSSVSYQDLITYVEESFKNDKNPVFFDTGFAGTIPLGVMEILRIDPDEYKDRIRMISAADSRFQLRSLRDLPRDKHSSIATDIERRPKPTGPSDQLYRQEGKVVVDPVASAPEDILEFEILRYAVRHHFYVKELGD